MQTNSEQLQFDDSSTINYNKELDNNIEKISEEILNAKAIIAIIGDNQQQQHPMQIIFNKQKQDQDLNDQMISFQALKAIVDLKGIDDYFVVTSNTDGNINSKEVDFNEDNYWELYGSMNYYQCEHGKVFGESNSEIKLTSNLSFDKEKHLCLCQNGNLSQSRPNVLMRNENNFNTKRSDQQAMNFKDKVKKIVDSKKNYVIFQFGEQSNGLNNLGQNLFTKSNNATIINVGKKGIRLSTNKMGNKDSFIPIKGIPHQESFSFLALKTLEKAKNRIKNPLNYHILKDSCYRRYCSKVNQIPAKNMILVTNKKTTYEKLTSNELTEDRFNYNRFKGIMAASFTPVNQDGTINFDASLFNRYAEDLLAQKVTGVFANGTSGESVSLSCDERKRILESWMQTKPVKSGEFTVICHIGCNNFPDTAQMLLHSQKVGAHGAAFMSPSYFRPQNAEQIANLICNLAELTPDFPIYYYHIPMMNSVDCNIEQCLNLANARCPNVVGMKYTGQDFDKYSSEFFKKFNVLVGADNMLVKSFQCGADGAIGIGYNFAGEWARNIFEAIQQGDLQWAEQNQDVFKKFWDTVFGLPYGLGGPGKHLMLSMRGIDLGPLRWPQIQLSEQGKIDTDRYVKPVFIKCKRYESKQSTQKYQDHPHWGQLTDDKFNYKRFRGIMAASFTPIKQDGTINFSSSVFNKYAEDLITQNVTGVFANGTSGESVSLSCQERQKILSYWMNTSAVIRGDLTVICHIGCNNFTDSVKMLKHAQKIGAHGAAFMSPSYFKPKNAEQIADLICNLAELTPDFPIYYYHIPMMNGVDCDVEKCLNLANARCPNVVGMKYTGQDFDKYSPKFFKKFNVLVGADNMLVKSFQCGADGAIGIGYNFAGKWARNVYDAIQTGDLIWAHQNQHVFKNFWDTVFGLPHGLGGPGKYLMLLMRGIDLGPLKWPQVSLSEQGKIDTERFVQPVFQKCVRESLMTEQDKEELVLEGFKFPQSYNAYGSDLSLRGAGTNKATSFGTIYYCININISALYVQQKSLRSSSSKIVNQDKASMIQLTWLSNQMTSDEYSGILDKRFKQMEDSNESLRSRIQLYKRALTKLVKYKQRKSGEDKKEFVSNWEFQKGDLFNILYTPEKGTQIYRNDKLIQVIQGLDFKQALWSYWLGSSPVNMKLKKAMLGY